MTAPSTEDEAEPYVGSATNDLDLICRKLFGEDWAVPLHQATGINLRTCQRLRAAARKEMDAPASQGVLGQLREILSVAALECDEAAGIVAEAVNYMQAPARRRLVGMFARTMRQAAVPFAGGHRRAVGPIEGQDFQILLDHVEDGELALLETAEALIDALKGEGSIDARRPILKALATASGHIDSVFELDEHGSVTVLHPGTAILADFSESSSDNPQGWDALVMPILTDEDMIQHMAQVLGERPGTQVQPIRLLAEVEDEATFWWVLAISVEGDLVSEVEQIVFGLRRIWRRDAPVRWLCDVDEYRAGDICLMRREPGEEPDNGISAADFGFEYEV
jgi:hypothetical protein